MKCLVTGAAGFVGSHLVEKLLREGMDVIGLDSFEPYYPRAIKETNLRTAIAHSGYTFVKESLLICNLSVLLNEVDVVFHLAATPGVRASWGEGFSDYVANNVRATQRLLDACKDANLSRFVYASSSSIYGDSRDLPLSEASRPQPYSPYGVTKLSAEHLCYAYWRNYGVPTVSLRYFTVYGPRQRPDMAFNRFIRAAILGQPVPLFGDGDQTRDFTFVADVANATMLAGITAGIDGEVMNVGGGSSVTVRRTLEIIESQVGKPLDIDARPAQKGDVRDTCADSARISELLGFVPEIPVETGLAAEVEWMQDMIELYEQCCPLATTV